MQSDEHFNLVKENLHQEPSTKKEKVWGILAHNIWVADVQQQVVHTWFNGVGKPHNGWVS